MKQICHRITAALLLALLVLSCKGMEKEGSNGPLAKHVVLIGSDGFGAYAFQKAKVPNLRKLMTEGSYSLQARAVLPSSSAVNWASMLMGSGPELHGYTEWGSQTPEVPSRVAGKSGMYPSIFSVVREQRPEAITGVTYQWDGIGYLYEQDLVTVNNNGEAGDDTLELALEMLAEHKPTLSFIHFDEPDSAGHTIGHDTPEYYQAVEIIDAYVGQIVETLDKAGMLDDTIILFSSDHGGIGKGHGGKSLAEMEIPWIVWGKNIKPTGRINKSVVTYDTAATIAYVLGLEQPDFWRGKAITTIFKDETNTDGL